MATEELYTGIVNIEVYGSDAPQRVAQIVQQIKTAMVDLGALHADTSIGSQLAEQMEKGEVSVKELMNTLRRLQMESENSGLDTRALREYSTAIDFLIRKIEQLHRVQGMSPTQRQDPDTRMGMGRETDALRRQAEFENKIRDLEQDKQRLAREVAQNHGYDAGLGAVGLGRDYERRPTNIKGEEKYPGRVDRVQYEADLEEARRSVRPADELHAATEKLARARVALASAEESQKVSGDGFKNDPAANENLSKAEGDLERALKEYAATVKRVTDAELKHMTAAEQAAERERIQGDPERMKLLRSEGKEFLEGTGVDTTQSIKMQELRTEEERLALSRQSLARQVENVGTEKEYAALLQEKTALERRILANQAGIERQKFNEGGRGGFTGGLLGNFGGSPEGIGGRDIAFQAGQAVKFYALYSALGLVQTALTNVITLSGEYTKSVADLAIVMRVSNKQAEEAASSFATMGQELGTGPVASVEGAAKFMRTFRTENADGTTSADPRAGKPGVELTGYINTLEGPDRIERVMQDMISLLKGYGLGAASAPSVYDQATVIAQQGYGFKSAGEVITGAAAVSDIGREAGYSMPELIALIAGVMQRTGTSSDAAAGDVKRILGGRDSDESNRIFEGLGISLDLTFNERIQSLSKKLREMDPDAAAAIQAKLTSDPRTGATYNALLEGVPQAQNANRLAGGATGAAADQVSQKLGTLGGQLQLLKASAENLAIAFGSLGLTDLMTHILQVANNLAGAVRELGSMLDMLPDPVKKTIGPVLELATALGLLYAGTKAAAAGKAAFAGNEILGGLVGRGGGAAAAAEAEKVAQLQRKASLALVSGNAALSASYAAEAAAAGTAAAATTTLTGRITAMGLSMLKAAPMMGLLAGAVVAFMVVMDAQKKWEQGQDAAHGAIRDAKDIDAGIASGDVDKLAAARDALKKERENLRATSDGFTGVLTDVVTPGLEDARAKALGAIDAKVDAAQKEIDRLNGIGVDKDAANAPTYFGQGNIRTSYGIKKIEKSGIGADAATTYLKQLVDSGDLDHLFPQSPDDAGAKDFLKVIEDKINRSTNPLEQQSQLGGLRQQYAKVAALAKGTDNEDAAQQLYEQANRAYLDVLISNTNAKIENIRAIQGDGPKATNKIKDLVKAALKQSSGDVGATAELLSLVDKAFLDTYKAELQAQARILQNKIDSIQEAVRVGTEVADHFSRMGITPEDDAQQAEVDAINKQIATMKEAAKISSFTGSALGKDKKDKPEDVEAARLAAQARPGDDVSAATAQLNVAKYQLDNASKGTVEYWNAVKAVKDAQYQLAQALVGQGNARLSAGAIAGDSYSQATTALAQARNTLHAAVKGTTEYWNALAGLHNAQYELAQLVLERANNYRILRSDVTDPVDQANIAVKAAADKLRADRARGASSATIVADQVALKQAQASAASTQWSQTFGDMQTNYELNRISLSAYLKYLNSQKAYLEAVKNKTRDQVEQLNQVDQALKGLADSLQGQWNLGDIKVPTPYEARRAMAANGAAMNTTNNVTINGADTAAVMQMLQSILGVSVIQSATTAPKKV